MTFEELTADGYFISYRSVSKKYGSNVCAIFGELCTEYNYWKSHNGIDDDGWFYSTIENIAKASGIGRTAQDNAIKTLVDAGYIETTTRGMPRKRYFRIPCLHDTSNTVCMPQANNNACDKQTSLYAVNNTVCTPQATNINKNNNKNNNKGIDHATIKNNAQGIPQTTSNGGTDMIFGKEA